MRETPRRRGGGPFDSAQDRPFDSVTRPFPTRSESRTRRVSDRLRDPSCALRMRKRRRVALLDIRHRMNSQTVLH